LKEKVNGETKEKALTIDELMENILNTYFHREMELQENNTSLINE